MNLLTCVYLIRGKNRVLLLEKLKNNGVRVLKVKNIDENCLEITIDNKDCDKFFAICKKRWYNEKVKVGGLAAPLWKLVRKPFLVCAVAIFILLSHLFNYLYLGTDFKNDAILYGREVNAVYDEVGIKTFGFFNDDKLLKVKNLLEQRCDFAFLTIQKCGNRSIIDIKRSQSTPKKMVRSKSDVVADEDVKILKISVYSGTALVCEGDEIKSGTTVIGAYQTIREQRVACEVYGYLLVQAAFDYEYECKLKPDNADILRAEQAAKFALGDYEVRSVQSKIQGKTIKIRLYYEKLLFGG